VRPYINDALQFFRRDLYIAILNDPPRYLLVGYMLQHRSIFEEAMVHIVGQHPAWPASWSVHSEHLPEMLHSIIDHKASQLSTAREYIDNRLLSSRISIYGTPTASFPRDPDHFSAGYAAGLWHDWFRNALFNALPETANGDNSNNNSNVISLHGTHNGLDKMGPTYRAIALAGTAYLDHDEVFAQLPNLPKEICTSWSTLEPELAEIKRFAQNVVQPLVMNNSWLDPEAYGLEYLTCTELSACEFPWSVRRVEAAGEGEDDGDEMAAREPTVLFDDGS